MAEPWILGISASHNGAACLLRAGEVVVAIQEERLSRLKRDRIWAARPSLAVACCLETAGITAADLGLVVACVQGHPDAPEQDLRSNPQLELDRLGVPSEVISHHTGHAAHAVVSAGWSDAAVLVVDGLGSPIAGDLWEGTTIFGAVGGALTIVERQGVAAGAWLIAQGEGMPRFRSVGGMYSAVAQQIFGDPMEAGKVMGLAPLGTPTHPVDRFFGIEAGRLVFRDGVPAAFREPSRWPLRERESADLASSAQQALEAAVLHLARRSRELTGASRLAYAGGVALNCVLNERLIREAGFHEVHIPPAAEDSGCALGAAFWGHRSLTGVWPPPPDGDRMGPRWGAPEGLAVPAASYESCRDPLDAVAERLAAGQIGGVWSGRSELGPRALGQRSILADPRGAEMAHRLNVRIKRREAFRPFAPAVLAEAVDEWFALPPGLDRSSPSMLRVWEVRADRRARIPAVVHVDGSARVQTVSGGLLRDLIVRFAGLTQVPILLNTSFNGPGEPLVETAQDALWCCAQHGLDFVLLEDRLVVRDPHFDLLSLRPVILGVVEQKTEQAWVLRIATPWGPRVQRVPPALVPLLEAADGTRTGRDLLGSLTVGSDHPEDWLRQALIQLRNARVIRLDGP